MEEYLSALNNSGLKLKKLFLSWDSEINHYPTSNEKILEGFRKTLKAKYGYPGEILIRLPWMNEFLRHRNSKYDHTPGRMISFIAKA
jgi:hypothetical protein